MLVEKYDKTSHTEIVKKEGGSGGARAARVDAEG